VRLKFSQSFALEIFTFTFELCRAQTLASNGLDNNKPELLVFLRSAFFWASYISQARTRTCPCCSRTSPVVCAKLWLIQTRSVETRRIKEGKLIDGS
jgi:hypothetical protein